MSYCLSVMLLIFNPRKDDNALIAHIIRSDYVLPLFPLWDPNGLLIKEAIESKDMLDTLVQMKSQGLFNPRKWGMTDQQDGKMTEIQEKLKMLILRRLYPGLRKTDDFTLKKFITRYSPIEDQANTKISNNMAPYLTAIEEWK